MTLTELLPTIRQLSAIDKRELIRILMAEEDINEDIFPLEPYKIYYLPTPYNNFGAGAALMQAMNLPNSNEN
ncbi:MULTISPECIES: hypothetical protein [Kamptonema]|uniref:hypothetical protein n=1 Tax=Kamptonema TaxID=1501433 RepID=UPI0001DAC7B6|nr:MULTISPECIES: hypothetical protein [Kamptonema]CBN54355.1 conserved hypothetical protein [Kamptonema sp. PCC 6506]